MFINSTHKKIRLAINGFGRIGRSAFKVALEKYHREVEVVAINDLTSVEVLSQLLRYDSAYGVWLKNVTQSIDERINPSAQYLIVEGRKYPIIAEKDPSMLPWKNYKVDVVLECTGRFTDVEGMGSHLKAGAKKVVLSAPARNASHSDAGGPASSKDNVTKIPTYLMGVNHQKYQGEALVSNASCTTNCIAPVLSVIEDRIGILKAVMTTTHGVTAEQNLVDGPPPGGKKNDLRRARAAYVNIIPTSTGAAIATTETIPSLKGIFDGRALRVPVIVGSISDITILTKKKVSVEIINKVLIEAAKSARWKGILACSNEPLVSTDIIGRSESSIVDLNLTQVVDKDLVKIFAWYDNEWGYSHRLVEQAINVCR